MREVKIKADEVVRFTVDTAICVRKSLIDNFKASDEKGLHPVYYYALSYLIGKPIPEVVKMANQWADDNGHKRITTRQFCRWLAEMLSRFFRETQ